MRVKRERQSEIWGMLFTFFAISKTIYYFDIIISAFNRGGLWAMGEALLNRLLTQDILIILVILLTSNTDKFVQLQFSKYNKTVSRTIVHIIDYLLYMGALAIYFWSMIFLGIFQNFGWSVFIVYSSAVYFAIVTVVETKKYLKKKEKTEYAPVLSADEKLDMIKTLLDNSVLTQEEYDRKKEELLGVL